MATAAAPTTLAPSLIEPIARINRDVREASKIMTEQEARFLVSTYYQVQEYRKTAANQVRALSRAGEPNAFLLWVFTTLEQVEAQVQRALDRYTDGQELGRWCKSITGIGPVLAAGLMANIDITRAPSVSHIWRFAGLDPTTRWEKGQKRPWNADLKRLCWLIGESFNKQKSRPNDHYGKFIDARKAYEWRKNIAGDYAEQARRILATKRIDKSTEAYAWYSGYYRLRPEDLDFALAGSIELKSILDQRRSDEGVPMLPPGHIHERSKRFAVKIFLSHYHTVAHELHYGEPAPVPYAIAHLDHVDEIPVINWPLEQAA